MRSSRRAYAPTLLAALAHAALGCGAGPGATGRDGGAEAAAPDVSGGAAGGAAGAGGGLAGAGGGLAGAGGGLAGTDGGLAGTDGGGDGLADGGGPGGAGGSGAGGSAGAGGGAAGGSACGCGTPPCLAATCADTDHDGLADAWESAGCVDMDCNGSCADAVDIPLPGASTTVPDIYVRYDYMVATATNAVGTPPHSHQPPAAALEQVRQAFAAHGIALHWIAPPGPIPEHQVTTRDPAPAASCAGPDFVTTPSLRAQAFAPVAAAIGPALQHPAYHYLVFAHNAVLPDTGDGSRCPADRECDAFPDPFNSGSSDVFGDDMIVAFGADLDQMFTLGIERIAGTTMHEIGHNLGLKHGSLAATVADICLTQKPNYVSVMGYMYQNGIRVATAPGATIPMLCDTDADCSTGVCATAGACHCTDDLGAANSCYRIDFASDKLLDLDESMLDESLGVGGPESDQDIVVYFAQSTLGRGPAFGPIDWNQDGTIETGVIVDVDNSGAANALLRTTTDWDKLQLAFQCSPAWGVVAMP
jgi:hypothetical protein